MPEPAEGDEGYDHKLDEVKAKNEEITKENAKWQKVQSKCQIAQQELVEGFEADAENKARECLVTLLNYKDPEEVMPPPEESKKSLPQTLSSKKSIIQPESIGSESKATLD